MFRIQYRLMQNNKWIGLRCNTPAGTKDFDLDFVRENIEKFNEKENRSEFSWEKLQKILGAFPIVNLSKDTEDIGIFQVLRQLNCYDDILFVNIDREISCSELKIFLDSNQNGKKYIFIDEITRIRDFLTESSFLYDRYTSSGIHVVISGTDSLSSK